MAQNYTRQSTLSDGDTITASLFNDEYNQLVNAFTYSSTSASSTGHRHDGSSGQGGNIFKIGDLDFLNKIEVDSTNNRWGFYVEVSSAAVEQIRIQDGAIVPVTTNDIDLGTASLQFKDLYIDGTANVDSLTLTSGATVTTILDEDDLSSDSATALVTQQSVKAYVDSQVTAQDLDFQADSGGALSIDLDSETLTFTGGTGIDTSGSDNAVTFAIDSTVATLTGTQTLTNKTLTSPDVNTPDIDGGTIDGTVIGGTTPAAVSATTVSATGNITVGGTVDGRDVATDGTKLDGIESGATADQTAAEIRTLVESATDSNVFTDADHTKLDGIEANATGDQTNAEIRAAVEAATDSNVFTDADHSKLDGIEALADVTDTTNVTAAGAVMDSELTNETAVKSLDQGVATTDSPTFAGVTVNGTVEFDGLSGTGAVSVTDILDQDDMSSNSATALATQQSIKAYVDSQVATADTLAEVLANGNTTGGTDVAFGDNDKAIFGAGSDLEIYHDGSASYIVDNGTGNLRLQGVVQVADDPSSNDGRILFGDDGNAKGIIHYDYSLGDFLFENTWANSAGEFKFTANSVNALTVSDAGIDVTGTVTADSYDIGTLGTLGSVATDRLFIATADGLGLQFDFDNSRIVPVGADGSTYNNNVSLGSSGLEFKNLLLSGNATVGGTVTADGLTVDASTSEMITLNHSTPSNLTAIGQDSSGDFRIRSDSVNRLKSYANGDFELYEDTGTTAKFEWDSSEESLTIGGGSTTQQTLRVTGAHASALSTGFDNQVVKVVNTSASKLAGIDFVAANTNGDAGTIARLGGFNTSSSSYLGEITLSTRDGTGMVERVRVDASGNVGIGTDSVISGARLDVRGANANNLSSLDAQVLTVQDTTSYAANVGGGIAFGYKFNSSGASIQRGAVIKAVKENGTDGDYSTSMAFATVANGGQTTEKMRIDSSGNVGIGTSSPAYTLHTKSSSGGVALIESTASNSDLYLKDSGTTYNYSNGIGSVGDALRFRSGDGTEAMRIDSSGNLLVGKSVTTFNTTGMQIDGSNGNFSITASGATTAFFNRTSTDGAIAEFYKDGTAVGSIGTANGNAFILSNDVGLTFAGGNDAIFPTTSAGAYRDAAIDLGGSGQRFKDLYLSGNAYANTYRHDGDSDTYLNFPAANQLSLVGGGATIVKAYQIAGAYGVLEAHGSGSATYPNYTFNGDSNTGMYRATTDTLAFTTGGSERMRLDASGNLLVGKTSTNIAVAGCRLGSFGAILTRGDGAEPLRVNRTGSDGDVIKIDKDGTTVGSIQSRAGVVSTIILDPRSGQGAGLTGAGAGGDTLRHITPTNESGTEVDGKVSLGNSSNGFKDLYLSGGAYLGGTGSANLLDDFEEGDHTTSITCSTSGTVTVNTTFDSVSYVKVGRLVTVTGLVIVGTVSSPVGAFSISMPFVAASSGVAKRGSDSAAAITVHNGVSANSADYVSTIGVGSSSLTVYLGDDPDIQTDSAQQLQTGTQISFHICYPTN